MVAHEAGRDCCLRCGDGDFGRIVLSFGDVAAAEYTVDVLLGRFPASDRPKLCSTTMSVKSYKASRSAVDIVSAVAEDPAIGSWSVRKATPESWCDPRAARNSDLAATSTISVVVPVESEFLVCVGTLPSLGTLLGFGVGRVNGTGSSQPWLVITLSKSGGNDGILDPQGLEITSSEGPCPTISLPNDVLADSICRTLSCDGPGVDAAKEVIADSTRVPVERKLSINGGGFRPGFGEWYAEFVSVDSEIRRLGGETLSPSERLLHLCFPLWSVLEDMEGDF